MEQHISGVSKRSDLVFQVIEVDARLSAYSRIDHRQQSSGKVDEGNATFKRRSSEASKVCHHAATKVQQARMAGGFTIAQGLPHLRKSVELLVSVGWRDDNLSGLVDAGNGFQFGKTEPMSRLIGKNEESIGANGVQSGEKVLLDMVGKDHFLLHV